MMCQKTDQERPSLRCHSYRIPILDVEFLGQCTLLIATFFLLSWLQRRFAKEEVIEEEVVEEEVVEVVIEEAQTGVHVKIVSS